MAATTSTMPLKKKRELVRRLLYGKSSPFTLILDSLAQSGKPFIHERIRRSEREGEQVIYVCFETAIPPRRTLSIPAYALTPEELRHAISQVKSSSSTTGARLIVIDSLRDLLANESVSIASYLSSLLGAPKTSLLAVYHIDQPAHLSNSNNSSSHAYQPNPLTLLRYLATTVVEMHSLKHLVAAKSARDRSLSGPSFGLAEEEEGVLIGLGSNGSVSVPGGSVVVEAQMRRESGRAEQATFVLLSKGFILLEDHPLFNGSSSSSGRSDGAGGSSKDEVANEGEVTSFKLTLTDKERRDREHVILPYTDAQNERGIPGEGGRILYDMGEEDDFDEEEDEI